MNCADSLLRIRIVLSHPSHPGNIGAAARAMKTMGVQQLYLVNPRRFPDEEAIARAAGASGLLNDAVVCARLEDALEGTLAAAGFTARKRELAVPARWLREAAPEWIVHAAHGVVALVFGNETSGLSNEELALCQFPVMIPTVADYASLNLGAAVQLACYEARVAATARAPTPRGMEFEPARFEEIEGMIAHLERAVTASGFLDPTNPQRLMPRFRRLFNRTRLEREEVNIVRGMLRSFMPKVD